MKYLLASLWLLFTATLAGWWYIFHLRQIERIRELDHDAAAELARNQSMLAWEGATLLLCLIGGGIALLVKLAQLARSEATSIAIVQFLL